MDYLYFEIRLRVKILVEKLRLLLIKIFNLLDEKSILFFKNSDKITFRK